MNFIAGSARKIARFLSAPATGKGRNALSVVRKNCPRSFRCSPHPPWEHQTKLHRAAACRVPAACAAPANRTGIESLRSVAVLGHSNAQQAIASGFSNNSRNVTLLRPRTGALRGSFLRINSPFGKSVSHRLLASPSPPNPACGFAILQASRHPSPLPAHARRWHDHTSRPVACRR